MIHLSRRQSIVLASGLIGTFFVLMFALSNRKHSLPEISLDEESPKSVELPPPTPTAGENVEPAGAQFQLHNFHRSEVKNGKKAWEIKAAHGQYFPEKQAAELTDADVWVFREEDKQVFLKAPRATLKLNGTELTHAIFPDTVNVVYDNNITLRTSHATYSRSENSVYSEAEVTVQNSMMDITGQRFHADLSSNKVVFSGGVKTLLKGKKNAAS